MKKIIFINFILFSISIIKTFGQDITITADSVEKILCNKKWEIEYAMMGNMKIGKIPGATDLNYEFNKDKTFVVSSNDPKDKSKGSWNFDPKKKSIILKLNGKNNSSIITLNEKMFVLQMNKDESMPTDMQIKVVYKLKVD